METLFPLTFSNSILKDVWDCELKFFRKHCQRLVGGNSSYHLLAGNHFAKACEIARNGFYNYKMDAEEAIDLGKLYILHATDTGDFYGKSNENVAYVFERYFQRFPLEKEFKPVPLADGTHAVEYYFKFDLGIPHPDILGQNICFTGILDAIYEQSFPGRNPRIVILDEKTTGKLSRLDGGKEVDYKREADKFRTSGQFIAYTWAAKQLEINVEEVLVRRVPLLSKFEPAFEIEIAVTDFMIDNWAFATVRKIEELVEKYKWYKTQGRFPQESFYPTYQDSCLSYGFICAFAQGCLNEDGESYLQSTHKQAIFDRETGQEYSLKDYKKLIGL